MTGSLKLHPTEKYCLLDDDRGEPLQPEHHIFRFRFKTIRYSDTYEIIRPILYKDGKSEYKDREERKTSHLAIELEPTTDIPYSYIGTRRLLKKFNLVITDFDDQYCNHEFPHVQIIPYYHEDDYEEARFTIYLFIDAKQKRNIIEDLQSDKFNSGSIEFDASPDEIGHVVFHSKKSYEHIPEAFFDMCKVEFNKSKHRYIGCHYPYKILPSNFCDFEDDIVKPYDDVPIREFSLTFNKYIPKEAAIPKSDYSPEIEKLIEWYQIERMNILFDADFE